MNVSRRAIFLTLAILLTWGGGHIGCGSNTDCINTASDGSCLPACINQSDCENNHTCLNNGVCACFKDQNGANCTDSSDCQSNQICNSTCRCATSPNRDCGPTGITCINSSTCPSGTACVQSCCE